MSPHASHFVSSLPPEGAHASLRRLGGGMSPPAPRYVLSLPASLRRLGGG
jgi:hypothetical protein